MIIIHIIPIISMKCVGLRIHNHCHRNVTKHEAAQPPLPRRQPGQVYI